MSSEIKGKKSCVKFYINKCHKLSSKLYKTTSKNPSQKEIPFLCPFNKKGSVTVEAAFVLPLYIMAIAAFLFYFQFITLQENISQGLCCAGWNAAGIYHLENVLPDIFEEGGSDTDGSIPDRLFSYAGDLAVTGITGAYVRKQVLDYVGSDYIDKSCIKNKSAGLLCYGYTDGELLRLGAAYEISIPFLPSELFTFKVSQQLTRRLWIGLGSGELYEDIDTSQPPEEGTEEEEKEKLYITKYGRVYHLYIDCQSIKRDVKTKAFSSIGELTNNEGRHYDMCELCVHGNANALVFVTADGERYHNSITCKALKRYISVIGRDETGSRVLCSFCKKREDEEHGTQ